MGHAVDMINRIKNNQEIKKRRDLFPTPVVTKGKSERPFNFKKPTEEELKNLELKNRKFLQQQKKTNLIAISISFTIAIMIIGWVYFNWPWDDMVVGFMKGYK